MYLWASWNRPKLARITTNVKKNDANTLTRDIIYDTHPLQNKKEEIDSLNYECSLLAVSVVSLAEAIKCSKAKHALEMASLLVSGSDEPR